MRRQTKPTVTLQRSNPTVTCQSLLARAATLIKLGKDNEAAIILRQALAKNPGNAVAHAMLGEVLAALNLHEPAIEAYSNALGIDPGNELTQYNLANSYAALGRMSEAENLYRSAIRQSPDFGAAHFNLGCLLRDRLALQEGTQHIETAATILPDVALVKYHLGLAYLDLGRTSEAIHQLRESYTREPSLLQPVLQTAARLASEDRQAVALALFQAVVDNHPQCWEAHSSAALILHKSGRPSEAIRHHKAICSGHPHLSECWQNLAIAQWADGAKEESIRSWQRATECPDATPITWFHLANGLRECGQSQLAVEAYDRAIQLDPQNADAHTNRGIELLALRRFTEAEEAQQRAIALAPDHDAAHTNLAILYLTRGDLKAGFAHYEHRLAFPKYNPRGYDANRWHGERLAGKTLLVWGEQGLGDQIQFSRYLNLLSAIDGQIVVQCSRGLGRLFYQWYPHCTIIECDRGDSYSGPAWQLQVSMMSLPHTLSTAYSDIVDPGIPSSAAPTREGGPLGVSSNDLNVGVVWAGSAHHFNNANRSMSLRTLEPILDLPSVQYYSFQKGEESAQVAALKPRSNVHDAAPFLTDWHATSACLQQMDLLVSVDTSVVHLAGSIGLPVAVLLPPLPDWRWKLSGETSTWYPSVRLLRATKNGEWASTVNSISELIIEAAALKRLQTTRAA